MFGVVIGIHNDKQALSKPLFFDTDMVSLPDLPELIRTGKLRFVLAY